LSELRIVLGPQAQGTGPNESFWMIDLRAAEVSDQRLLARKDFIGLPQVTGRAHFLQSRGGLHQRRDRRVQFATTHQRATVRVDLRIETQAARSVRMTARRPGIVRRHDQQPVGGEKIAALGLPQAVMRHFVAQDGVEFGAAQRIQQHAGENDVHLAGQIEQRRIRVGIAQRLIQRDGRNDSQALGNGRGTADYVSVPLLVQPVRMLQQMSADLLRVVFFRARRACPLP
jgi:hypothetical protein